jgi:hypothetical protein
MDEENMDLAGTLDATAKVVNSATGIAAYRIIVAVCVMLLLLVSGLSLYIINDKFGALTDHTQQLAALRASLADLKASEALDMASVSKTVASMQAAEDQRRGDLLISRQSQETTLADIKSEIVAMKTQMETVTTQQAGMKATLDILRDTLRSASSSQAGAHSELLRPLPQFSPGSIQAELH